MGDIKISKITLGCYMTNCYFLYREGSKETIVVDPADKGERIYEGLTERGLEVKAILLTHGHFDHILGVKGLKEKAGCKVYAYEEEDPLLMDPAVNVSEGIGRPVMIKADHFFKDGECCTLAGMTFKVIHTPGHTQGSCCYYFEEAGILISGDTLFCESVGRTDFPTGSSRKIIESITTKLSVLPENTKVYPGHGESTTIGYENENNPYIS